MRTLLVCLVLALAPGWVMSGQSKKEKAEEAAKRSVEGVVNDAEEQPVEGAIVQLKNLKTLQVRSFVTKSDGRYHFYGLSMNQDYEIKGEFSGAASRTRTLSVFDQRKKAIMDLKLEKK
ncbi:MAG: carboxypeptidase regulatory-like domain-containing protein [Acidobacteria bacterium]|nr:carboxypeptidase regulatory-like domain-containing protein [Acidobacteriota bacterium]